MESTASIEVVAALNASDELVSAFARLIPQLSTSAAPLRKESLAEIIAAPSNTVLLARDRTGDGTILGTLTLVIIRIPSAVRAWIEDVVVDSSARGRGIGEALTREAVRLATEHGAKTIDLTSSRSREAAHRLYEKVGFSVRESNIYRYVPARAANHESAGESDR